MPNLTPAPPASREALISCLRWDEEADRRLDSLTPTDWLAFLDVLVEGNGLLLLKRRLTRRGRDVHPPEEVSAAVRARWRAMTNRSMASVASIADCLKRAQRPLLLLKGIDISHRVYGSFGSRAMGDIDILAKAEDIPVFHAALLEQGYTTREPPTPERMADELWSQTIYFPTRAGGFPVELHWRLGNDAFTANIDADAIWQRAEPFSALGGLGARVMAREDLLLYLCLHIRHHTFDTPLTHVWDLAEVIEWAGPDFDREVFWQRAEAWRLTDTVHLAFRQLHDVLGVSYPAFHPDRVPPEIARLLPDVLPNLGRHPNHERVAEPHVANLLAPAIPLGQRLRRIGATLFAPRAHVAARYGVPAASWRLNFYYLAYWWRLYDNHNRTLRQWLSGDRAIREQSDRVYGLSEWLDTKSSRETAPR